MKGKHVHVFKEQNTHYPEEPQIILAVHNYAGANQTRLPVVDYQSGLSYGPAFFYFLLPYLEQDFDGMAPIRPLPVFISPADPTAHLELINGDGLASYCANAKVFTDDPRLPRTFADGVSNTIALAEHYAQCGGTTFGYSQPNLSFSFFNRRATFADASDYQPLTSGTPPTTLGGIYAGVPVLGVTFQVLPSNCDPRMPQTPHAGGMLVALADGSVRTLAPNMSEQTFWAAVTPAGNETLGPDW